TRLFGLRRGRRAENSWQIKVAGVIQDTVAIESDRVVAEIDDWRARRSVLRFGLLCHDPADRSQDFLHARLAVLLGHVHYATPYAHRFLAAPAPASHGPVSETGSVMNVSARHLPRLPAPRE